MAVGLGIDRLDQRPSDAPAAHVLVRVEVLKIADVLDPPAMAMEQEMRKAGGAALDLGDEATIVLRIAAEQTLERDVLDLGIDRRVVEGEIRRPEPPPLGVVGAGEGADGRHASQASERSDRRLFQMITGATASVHTL